MSSRFHREHVSLGESDNMRTLLHVTLKPLIKKLIKKNSIALRAIYGNMRNTLNRIRSVTKLHRPLLAENAQRVNI